MTSVYAMRCAGVCSLGNHPAPAQNAFSLWPHELTDTSATGERAALCSQREMRLKQRNKEKDSTPPKGQGDVAEMVKIMANIQPVNNKKLVKPEEKPKG
jgi:hypothetical protein